MLTVKELAKILKVSPKTIYKMVSEGEIPVHYRFGGSIRFDEREIREWIKKCRVVNPAPIIRSARIRSVRKKGAFRPHSPYRSYHGKYNPDKDTKSTSQRRE